MLIKENIQASLLTGSTPANERENIVEELNKGKIQTVIATSQLIGEGFDLPSMQKIFLTTPIKHHGRLIQYIGRVLRHDIGKRRAVIYDFYDAYDPVLRASAENRSKTYKAEFVKEINKPEPPQLKCKKCSKKFRSWANAVLCPSCQNKLFNHKR
jgi:superfamily II DNA or RNA helicase